MGGVHIDSALQVGFMLCALRSTYHRVVQDFFLGRHSLSSITLQSVVKQCMAYNKDPWKGLIRKMGNRFNPHPLTWPVLVRPATNPTPMMPWRLARLAPTSCAQKSLPITPRIAPSLSRLVSSWSSIPPLTAVTRHSALVKVRPQPAPAPPAPAPSTDGGLAATPGVFTAATKAASYDSGEEFDNEGKYEGLVYSSKSRSNVSDYPHASHATGKPLATTSESPHSCRRTTLSTNPKGVCTVYLPKLVLALLHNPPAHSTPFFSTKDHPGHNSLLVADTGATDHMLPDKSTFISYRPATGCCVRMGNNSFAPILGSGLAVISVNGRQILIWNCLHIPALRNPHQKPSFGHS